MNFQNARIDIQICVYLDWKPFELIYNLLTELWN